MIRQECKAVHLCGRLTQEYVVDAYAKIEEARLRWATLNQQTLRAELYRGIMDHVGAEDSEPSGRLIVLPSSFTGKLCICCVS